MNAASTVNWSTICFIPVVLLVLAVLSIVVPLVARNLGARPTGGFLSLKRILMFGIPLLLCGAGVLGSAVEAERGVQSPFLVAAPLLGAVALAAGAVVGLSRWAYPEWWGQRNRLLHPDRVHAAGRSGWGHPAVVVVGVILFTCGFIGLFASFGSGTGPRMGVGAFVLLGVGGFVTWFALTRRHPNLRKWPGVWLRAGRPPFANGQTVPVLKGAMSGKMGLVAVVVGAAVGGLVYLLTWHTFLAVVIGAVFAFVILRVQLAQLKVLDRVTAGHPRTVAVAPLLLTPDPTAVRGDCPTCGHAIPSDSPHGLCPRCLIRGAMPSPTSTRLRRGVSPIEPPSPAEVNDFFPHLEVLELVGAGGMGAVYKARQPTLDRVVALKIVQSPRGDEDPVFAERFAREARAMAKLDHPNIVTIHESGEAGGLPFLVMEYVDGVTLREAMANRLLTTVEALAVIPQVCDALDYAHRAGVVHRDIKPENILIDQTGRVKIADFGLAKLADPKNVTLTRTQQAMGTPHYMAPEQWEKPNDVDHRADVYALGVVLYELLTGELPLGRFALPSEKGKGDVKLDQVVIRALAKDPAERFQNAGQMKAALSGVKLAAFTPVMPPKKRRGFEYRSKSSFLGLPLVHVVAGHDPVTGKKRIAKGWIAVGDVMAVGGLAVGGVIGVGIIGVGGVTGGGVIGVGGAMALGALAIGGNAGGLLFALGGNAASAGLSIGGLAAGKFAIGGEAGGEYVISDKTHTPGFGDALLAWVRNFWPW